MASIDSVDSDVIGTTHRAIIEHRWAIVTPDGPTAGTSQVKPCSPDDEARAGICHDSFILSEQCSQHTVPNSKKPISRPPRRPIAEVSFAHSSPIFADLITPD
jgi:hypothetical protein